MTAPYSDFLGKVVSDIEQMFMEVIMQNELIKVMLRQEEKEWEK